jgi:drug/metabolite transporter (DMT)-like permease
VSWAGLFHLSVVYLVWAVPHLAIRVAVREGAGFPPFTLVTMRVLLGGALLLAWAGLSGRRLAPSRRELAILAASGLLLWGGGNGLVTWAEQRAHSGYAALLVGAAPIWAVLIESVLDRKTPSPLLIASLLVGFAGIGLLGGPVLVSGVRADVLSWWPCCWPG